MRFGGLGELKTEKTHNIIENDTKVQLVKTYRNASI